MKDFKQFFTESKEIDNLLKWAEANTHQYTDTGKGARVLSKRGKVQILPNSKYYANIIKPEAMKGQENDTGFILNLDDYILYAVEVSMDDEFDSKGVYLHIDKNGKTFKTLLISGMNLNALKSNFFNS